MPPLKFQSPEGDVITIDSPDGSMPSEQELDQLFALAKNNQPEQTVGSDLFGKIPLSEYQKGRMNVAGNIVERPAAANREAIRANPKLALVAPVANLFGGKESQAAAINPSTSETFQNEALRKYYGTERPGLLKTIGGFGVSTGGLVADIATNPAQVLTGLIPKTPIPFSQGRNVGQLLATTKPVQAISKFANTPVEELGITKALVNEKGGFLPVNYGPNIDAVINESIDKAIRPSVVGKNTSTQTTGYYSKARQAVQAIYDNKDNLVFEDVTHPMGYVNKLPESLNDFSSAIEQTKTQIWKEADTLAKQAGQEGATVPLNNISRELNTVANNKVLQDIRPEIANYAKEQALRFSKRKIYTPEEAQQAIKIYNQSLDAFYKNPTPDTASKAVIDSGIVNNLRKSLDDTITNLPEKLPSDSNLGQSYQQLKNTYGALKTIEKDVNRRAIVDARKNVKGLIDFTDVFSGGQMTKGILTLNPGEFTQGLAQKMIASYIKFKNNPNTMIKNMFRVVERVNSRRIIRP